MKKVKMFCIPYAGGTASYYFKWKKYIGDYIELIPVELKGRGSRFGQPFYNDINEAADDIFEIIKGQLFESKFIFFGHSMGALLVYELLYRMKRLNYSDPIHVFMSGRHPPYVKKEERVLHVLPDKEFIDEIKKYGGLSEEILNHEELLDLMIKVMKADYKILENYQFNKENFTINCDLTILSGTDDDEVDSNDLEEWKKCTNQKYDVHVFNGGHFFINDYTKEILKIINNKVNNKIRVLC